jgi:polyhydroxybutyrate depolymerase
VRTWVNRCATRLATACQIAALACACGGGDSGPASPAQTLTFSGSPQITMPPCIPLANQNCHSLTVTQADGTTSKRTYVLHVPTQFQPGTSALVIALHGAGESGEFYEGYSELDYTADQDGFAVVYPEALPIQSAALGNITEWNYFYAETFYGGFPVPDDESFIRQLITSLQTSLGPDPSRIYVTGLSSGGFMAHRVAVDLSDLVAAAGVISGSISEIPMTSSERVPNAKQPVSILMLQGDNDQSVLYCGGSSVPGLVEASQDTTFNYWSGASGDDCAAVDTTAPLCDSSGTPTSVLEKHATSCGRGTEVMLYRLIGGQHVTAMQNADLSSYNTDFNATTGTHTNDVLWNFFLAHPRQ